MSAFCDGVLEGFLPFLPERLALRDALVVLVEAVLVVVVPIVALAFHPATLCAAVS
jgi:hypothetical protein